MIFFVRHFYPNSTSAGKLTLQANVLDKHPTLKRLFFYHYVKNVDN